jgi:8-oxo-dGTP diphosphatase
LQSIDSTYVDVSAGILFDGTGRVLIAERTGDGSLQGMWEFPGGKMKAGETAEAALIRELREELGIEVQEFTPYMNLEHDYPDRSVRLHFFEVTMWQGEPTGIDGQKLRWVKPADIDLDSLLSADAPVIAALLA